jgi:hypothetical protein
MTRILYCCWQVQMHLVYCADMGAHYVRSRSLYLSLSRARAQLHHQGAGVAAKVDVHWHHCGCLVRGP